MGVPLLSLGRNRIQRIGPGPGGRFYLRRPMKTMTPEKMRARGPTMDQLKVHHSMFSPSQATPRSRKNRPNQLKDAQSMVPRAVPPTYESFMGAKPGARRIRVLISLREGRGQ